MWLIGKKLSQNKHTYCMPHGDHEYNHAWVIDTYFYCLAITKISSLKEGHFDN